MPHDRFHTTTEDARNVSLPVLRHRIVSTSNAKFQRKTNDDIIREVYARTSD